MTNNSKGIVLIQDQYKEGIKSKELWPREHFQEDMWMGTMEVVGYVIRKYEDDGDRLYLACPFFEDRGILLRIPKQYTEDIVAIDKRYFLSGKLRIGSIRKIVTDKRNNKFTYGFELYYYDELMTKVIVYSTEEYYNKIGQFQAIDSLK